MRNGPVKIIIGLLALILLAVTNPSREKHQAAIGERIGGEVGIPGAGGLGKLLSGLYDYRDYVFFSVTTYEGKVESIGIAGIVITF